MAYLLLYVDDIVLTASFRTLLQYVIQTLSNEFSMTDFGDLHYFLGISVMLENDGLFVSQKKYAMDILDRASMTNCKLVSTPVDTKEKLSTTSRPPIKDPGLYRALVGAL